MAVTYKIIQFWRRVSSATHKLQIFLLLVSLRLKKVYAKLMFHNNFGKFVPIFKILSPVDL